MNRLLIAVKQAVSDAGVYSRMNIGPPPAVGGTVFQNVDPLENLFNDVHGISMIPMAVDTAERAIGVYQQLI